MTTLDQFESVFKAASKDVYHFAEIHFPRLLLVHDLEHDAGWARMVKNYLTFLPGQETWSVFTAADYTDAEDLLARVRAFEPSLICTYRNLKSSAGICPYSLGAYLDVMTQVVQAPVLVLPHPAESAELRSNAKGLDKVMAITHHLNGDQLLVNYADAFTAPDGHLFLTHIEEMGIFENYMETISKISAIDTDSARELIGNRLLKEPSDYAEGIRAKLARLQPELRVEAIVIMGRRLREYKALIEQHQIDLLVFHTKNEDHLAMDGMAYPLAVELRQLPLLML